MPWRLRVTAPNTEAFIPRRFRMAVIVLPYKHTIIKPEGPQEVDWSNPLTKDFAGGWIFNEGAGSKIFNIRRDSPMGDLGIGSGSWAIRQHGRGIYCDNTQAQGSTLTITSPDPGWWHDAITSITILLHFSLELDAGGPITLLDIGGSTNGFYVGYRTSPDQIIFCTAQSTVRVEIASTTTFVPIVNEITVVARYDSGSMALFVNAVKEATGSNGSYIPSHSDEPGIGGTGGTSNAINSTVDDEWGGVIYDIFAWDRALSDEECVEISRYPYQILKPLKRRIWVFVGGTVTLGINEATHSHAADNISLLQNHVLGIAETSHDHAADNLNLSQVHNLGVDKALHDHSADNITLSQIHNLVIQDTSHGHTVDNLAIDLMLAIANAFHSHTADSLSLIQVHVLAIAEALHDHASDNLDLIQKHLLAINEALHDHSADMSNIFGGLLWADPPSGMNVTWKSKPSGSTTWIDPPSPTSTQWN